jgi:hypothetical protein
MTKSTAPKKAPEKPSINFDGSSRNPSSGVEGKYHLDADIKAAPKPVEIDNTMPGFNEVVAPEAESIPVKGEGTSPEIAAPADEAAPNVIDTQNVSPARKSRKAGKIAKTAPTKNTSSEELLAQFVALVPGTLTTNVELKSYITTNLGISESAYGNLKKTALAKHLIKRAEGNSFSR